MAAVALLLPLLSLTVLGSVWLWQNGYVLYWAMAACSITLATYAIERWVFQVDLPETAASARDPAGEQADPAWSVREAAAWTAIVDLSNRVKPLEITSRDEIFDLGVRAIETVARSMHPGEDHAVWKFTLPEAFALIERVSTKLSAFVSDSIPLGDRMTVGQFLRVYRWRSVIDVAEHAYDLWRIVRLMNPAAAAANEIREQLTRRAYDWGREELAKRLVQAYIREIGRAAIDLYSGRMRFAKNGGTEPPGSEAAGPDLSGTAGRAGEPVRILVAGQAGSGKSSLIRALIDDARATAGVGLPAAVDFTAYDWQSDETGGVLLIDSPGLADVEPATAALLAAVDQSDMIIWVISAIRPDRDAARAMLDTIRKLATSRLNHKPQPILGVLTHVDAVRPVDEWNPPYDLTHTGPAKVAAINDAISTAASDLGLTNRDLIPVSLRAGANYNIDLLRQRLSDAMPEAERVRALRIHASSKTGMKWGRVWTQVVNAGRFIKSGSGRKGGVK